MQAFPSMQQRRTFARPNGADGIGVPRLVAAEERHRKNLLQIRQLKEALCFTVSRAPLSDAAATGASHTSMPSSTPPVINFSESPWMGASHRDAAGTFASPTLQSCVAASPSQSTWTSTPVAALQQSQVEVEQLVRERNKLQRQCVELASRLGETSQRIPGAADVGGSGATRSTSDRGTWTPLHEAALAVITEVTPLYPSIVKNWRGTLHDLRALAAVAEFTLVSLKESNGILPSEEELAEALQRLTVLLLEPTSRSSAREDPVAADADLLQHARILEAEKESDCAAVFNITDRLTSVASQLRHEAAEKDETLQALQETVAELLEEKSQWVRRARASEEALAERYAHYREREKAWEQEVADLLQPKENISVAVTAGQLTLPSSGTVVVTPDVEETANPLSNAAAMEAQVALLEGELRAKSAELESLQQHHVALQATHENMKIEYQRTEAAQKEHIGALEDRLGQLEVEAQSQSSIIESVLGKVEDLSRASAAEKADLIKAHSAAAAQSVATLFCLQEAYDRIEVALAERTAAAEALATQLAAGMKYVIEARATVGPPERSSPKDEANTSGNPSAVSLATLLPASASVEHCSSHGHCGDTNASSQIEFDSAQSKRDDAMDDTEEIELGSPTGCLDVRKLQQSVKRISRERATLKRKLEHRSAALAEVEGELGMMRQLVAQRDAQLQAISAERTTSSFHAASSPQDVESVNAPKDKQQGILEGELHWINFLDLEEGEGEEGTVYPAPVDLSEWLLESQFKQVRFEAYVRQHLNEKEQLRLGAVGPLYHIGFSLLRMEGQLTSTVACELPLVWRRFLVQLQRICDVQLKSTVVSPPDAARCFYALARGAGLLDEGAASRDPLSTYTRIVSALTVCVRPGHWGAVNSVVHEENTMLTSADAQGSSTSPASTTWHCCRMILRHVCQQTGDVVALTDRQAASAESTASPHQLLLTLSEQLPGVVPAQEKTEGSPSEAPIGSSAGVPRDIPTLAHLLSNGMLSGDGFLSHLSACAAVFECFVGTEVEEREGVEGAAAQRADEAVSLTSESQRVSRPPTHYSLLPLLLFVARYEYLLSSGSCGDLEASAFEGTDVAGGADISVSLQALGVTSVASLAGVAAHTPSHAHMSAEPGRSPGQDEMEVNTQVLVFLDAVVLPALVAIARMSPELEFEAELLKRYFFTRRRFATRRAALLSADVGQLTSSSASDLLPGVPLLSEKELHRRTSKLLMLRLPSKPLTPEEVTMPVAHYEGLHRELLALYHTNEKYQDYLSQLLEAANCG